MRNTSPLNISNTTLIDLQTKHPPHPCEQPATFALSADFAQRFARPRRHSGAEDRVFAADGNKGPPGLFIGGSGLLRRRVNLAGEIKPATRIGRKNLLCCGRRRRGDIRRRRAVSAPLRSPSSINIIPIRRYGGAREMPSADGAGGWRPVERRGSQLLGGGRTIHVRTWVIGKY